MKNFRHRVILLAFVAACKAGAAGAETPQSPTGAAPGVSSPSPPTAGQVAINPAVPAFLQTAFIEMTSPFTATTYDFVQQQAAGRMTMEIRNWQRIGTLGWQSFQQFTADYQANDQLVTFVSPDGYADTWTYYAVGPIGMDVIDSAGRLRSLFNCTAAGWPTLILWSTRSCTGF
jgi:hypothetical protein